MSIFFLPFSTLNVSCPSLLAFKVLAERSAQSYKVSLICNYFSLAAFKKLSSFAILIIICLCVYLFGFLLFGTHCDSCTWKPISFYWLAKFSAIISSNSIFPLLSPSSISKTPIIWKPLQFCCPRGFRNYPHYKKEFFCCSDWIISTVLSSRSLIHPSEWSKSAVDFFYNILLFAVLYS